MVSIDTLKAQLQDGVLSSVEYRLGAPLDLLDAPTSKSLATQAWPGRQLKFCVSDLPQPRQTLAVRLCEDDYPGWLGPQALTTLEPAAQSYQASSLTRDQISSRLQYVIAFMLAAMDQPNQYLWGGTIGPNFDCSGLMQRAFAEQGIWLPRDAYQQEAFTQTLTNPGSEVQDFAQILQAGDLIFFGPVEKANHVALYLGDGKYIHSSGTEQGRNGIGIDLLSPEGDAVTQAYYGQIHGAGRIIKSYQPQTPLT
ncbi:C40 family peptidase [Acaryochloris sp. 'Moss Beach']|uniref:C40 family peptidase n=1 Tax=Acaryochloris sp. 'Moss Beach' TaxID=2740837 RepID=UPI001F45D020|nr:C40 family peptidase [Acaryochloris sp. 'Moss Beach']UJB68565.1 C40 family peptidase [Acaryochloris sp. 'Moss Beach']